MKLSQIILSLILIFLLSSKGYNQYLGSPQLSGIGLPYFNTEVFPTVTKDGKQRIVRIYIQLINDDINFISVDTGYVAEIQIDIYLSDEEQDFVFTRTLNKEIFSENFDETNSRKIINMFSTEIPIDSGKFETVITVLDKNTGRQVNRKIYFELPSINELPFIISEVLIFDRFEKDSSGKILNFIPNLTGNFSSDSDFVYLYFDTFITDSTYDSLNIHYVIRDAGNYINQQNQYSISDKNKFKEHFIQLSRHQFERARYSVEISASTGKYQYAINKLISFFWTISPNSPQDIDLALKQLDYLADRDSINYYLKQPFESKRKYFERFWSEMDPNPDTHKNELMDEYYRRINIANQSFSTMSQEGWLTDRGRIFIKFGQPDDIERHPFEMNSYPYEIWQYYTLRKVFLFIDRLGFGDYYLHPSYLDEEYN